MQLMQMRVLIRKVRRIRKRVEFPKIWISMAGVNHN